MHSADAFAFRGRAACRNARLSLAGRLSRRICFLRVRQGIAQFLACSMQSRADGRGFAMCELGDLFGRVTFDVVQVNGEPPCFRQLLHRLPNRAFRQGGKGARFGIVGGIPVCDSFERRPLLVGSDHRTPAPSRARTSRQRLIVTRKSHAFKCPSSTKSVLSRSSRRNTSWDTFSASWGERVWLSASR